MIMVNGRHLFKDNDNILWFNRKNLQLVKANGVSGYTNDVIWNNKYISLEMKAGIYEIAVMPTLM